MTKPFSMIQIGAGSMGGALLTSFVKAGILDPARSAIVDPNPGEGIAALLDEAGIALNPEDDQPYDICVLAVKPQMFGAVLPELRWPAFSSTLFLSIAAGITADEIAMLLSRDGSAPKVVRAMPALPAKVGRGVTLLADGPALSGPERDKASRLFEAAGKVHWCADEDGLDRLMGVTGCGPAFFLRAAEGMAAAAEAEGASKEEARFLAEETFIATALLLSEDGRPAAALREAVTSPGGTTAAGLALLDEKGLVQTFVDAVRAAYARAKALAAGGK